LGGVTDFFTAAVFEEIIFRGYVFWLLYQAAGPAVAIVASSIVFCTAHLLKHPNVPFMYVLNTFIFGLIAAFCRHYTGSLWLPIGLHFGWNVVSGPIFGLPYSGRTYDRGVVVSEVSGPAWLTGGPFSLDAGVLGTVALVIAAVGLTAVTPI
jgi:membrane protease YdiL (CAAX protease family)